MQENGLREALDTTCSVYVSRVTEWMWGMCSSQSPQTPHPHLACTMASTPKQRGCQWWSGNAMNHR